jgi:hypothetical protein
MKSNSNFDPKLKELMEELEPIFEKYEVIAFVTATSRTHGEFRIFFPKRSTCFWEKTKSGQMGLRFKSKKGEQSHRDTEDTTFGIMSIRDMGAQLFQWMEQLKSKLDQHMEIDHKPQPITPDAEGAKNMTTIRKKVRELALLIEGLCPNTREKATALTQLSFVMMAANSAIVQQYPLDPSDF